MTIFVDQEKPSLAELAHHGVKGMKWGVRKDDSVADVHRTTEARGDRKQASHAATAYMVKANMKNPSMRKMTPEKYAALTENGRTFAAGLELNRITKANSETIRAGALFVSKEKEDQEFYKAIIPATGLKTLPFLPGSFVSGGQKVYESYEQTLKTTQKLKLPSDKERVDAFMHILSQPVVAVPGKNAPVTGRAYLEAHGYGKQFAGKTDQQATFSAYYQFLRTQGNQSDPVNKAYFDHLRAKGYNAVLDENDAGRYSKDPLILLTPDKSVKSTGIRRLTADEINSAQRNLKYTRPPGLGEKKPPSDG
jgi:hypothetical protein